MIIIMTDKQLEKNIKKLCDPREYFIGDATQDEGCNLTKYRNCVSMEGLAPGSRLVRLRLESDKDDIISDSKIDKLEQKWITHDQWKKYATACLSIMLNVYHEVDKEDHHNLFIVMKKKAYKVYGEMIRDELQKLVMQKVPSEERFAFCKTFDEMEKNFYKQKLTKEQRALLEDRYKKIVKKLQKREVFR